jgi:phage terminase small subunit
MKEPDITPKQLKFIREYMIEPNATQAAIKAGFSGSTGSQLLAKPHIKAALAEQLNAQLSALSINADWVLSRLKHEALYTGENASHGARVAALAQLAKILSMYVPAPSETSKVNFFINIGQPSEQLIN